MKQGQFFKKAKSLSLPNNFGANQRGQAVVEYVLLLVLIVSMLLAAQGIFSGVNTFIGNYVGKYFVCLMDHGELPAQGVVDTAGLAKHNEQSSCKVKFSIANGATLVGSGGSSLSSNGSGKSSTSNRGNNNKTNDSSGPNSSSDSKSKTSSANRNGTGGSGDSDGSSGRSPYADGRLNRSNSGRGTADGANDSANGKVKIIEDEQPVQSAFGSAGTGSANRTEYRYNRYKAIVSGQMYDEVSKNSKREQRQPSVKTISKVAPEEGFRPGPRKNAFVAPERKPAAESSDKDTNFGFGSMLKWLIIGGMVIALIVFFGGQVMNYSNSD